MKSEKKSFATIIKQRFTAKRLALIAVFTALSFTLSFLEIPMPLFGASFLKLDFGNVFILLISFLLGPIEGVIVCLLKESLRLIGSSSLGAGELANFIVTSCFILLPSIIYRYRKNFKTVIITLIISSIIAVGVALIVNRYIIFPTFAILFGGSIFGMTVKEAFSTFWLAVLIFNFIKTVSVSIFTILLYKRLSNLLKKWSV